MLKSFPVSTIQIVDVTGAILLIHVPGDVGTVNLLTGWMGFGVPPTNAGIPVNSDNGKI